MKKLTAQQRWELRNPEWRQQYNEKNRERIRVRRRRWLARSRDAMSAYLKKRRASIRAEMLAQYGPDCRCCGEPRDEFLTLDHGRGPGPKDSSGRRLGGHVEYQRLRSRGWPQDLGLRVLCMNCNWVARKGAVCPHETERTSSRHAG